MNEDISTVLLIPPTPEVYLFSFLAEFYGSLLNGGKRKRKVFSEIAPLRGLMDD